MLAQVARLSVRALLTGLLAAVASGQGLRTVALLKPAAIPVVRTAPADAPSAAHSSTPFASGAPSIAAEALPVPVAAPAPAPPPAASLPACPTPLQALQVAGDFDLLAQLIAATSLGGSSLFGNASLPITIFAPTDAGIMATMRQLNLNMSSLQQSPNTLTAILKYHVLPSPLMPTALEDGYSFNTLLYEGSTPNPESLTIRKPTAISTVVLGAKSSANLTTIPLPNTCNAAIYPLAGVLLPSL